MSNLIVTKPCALVRDKSGRFVYLYAGAVVPDGLDDDDVKRLTDEGFFSPASSKAAKEFDASDPASTSPPAEVAAPVKASSNRSK